MKKRVKGWKALLLLIMVAALVIPKTNGYALTQKQRALNAYKQFLAKSNVSVLAPGQRCLECGRPYKYTPTRASLVSFGLAYIDNDNIPELILKTDNDYSSGSHKVTAIFTYVNGKIKRVKSLNNDYAQFNGYYYKTGCFKWTQLDEGGYKEEYFYTLKNGNYQARLWKSSNSYGLWPTEYYKFVNTKKSKISGSAFLSAYKSVTASKKITYVKFYKDTAANRNAHLR